MRSRNRQLSRAAVVGALTMGAVLAIAPARSTLALTLTPTINLAAAALPSETMTFEVWSVPDLFAIEVPTGWLTTAFAEANRAIITSYEAGTQAPEPTDMLTEITLVSEPPETYVPSQLDGLIEAALAGEYVIDRYGITSVGGNDAFRLWMEEVPGDFSRQVITFVGDGQGRTAQIVSSYNDETAATRDLIVQMHGSLSFAPPAE